jgi:imidazolonepropionase-like amidohydrolase
MIQRLQVVRRVAGAAALVAAGFWAVRAPAIAAQAKPTCIVGVTVIDPATGARSAHRRVVISGDRIADVLDEASAGPTAACATVVDGSGRFLIPGLWDMHAHGSRRDSLYPLYIANGVTGMREMFGPPDARAFRAALAAKGIDAPHIYLASPILDGSPPIWRGSIAVTIAEEARRVVAEQHEHGADFLKVYDRLPREAYFAILAEAHRLGMPVAGHVPGSVSVWDAVAAGQRTIEHLVGVPTTCSDGEVRSEPVNSYAAVIRRQAEAARAFNPARCQLLYDALRRNGTWVVPTFTSKRADGWQNEPEFRADDRLRYFDADVRRLLDPPRQAPADLPDPAVARELFAFDQKIVGEMARAGVGILAGTDSMNPYVFPAFSLHDELALLVDAGLSPLAALQAATFNAAKFTGAVDRYGAVAAGKAADLVLLDADPLADIHHTTRIRTVFLGGKLFDRAALDALLARAEAAAKLP